MIDEINSTELHTCLLEITLLPLAHYWHFWYSPLDAGFFHGIHHAYLPTKLITELNR